jgi:hypothetical protein
MLQKVKIIYYYVINILRALVFCFTPNLEIIGLALLVMCCNLNVISSSGPSVSSITRINKSPS